LTIGHARKIRLPRIHDARGNLTFVEGGRHVPFDIRRVYYLYDIPSGATRAGHAHKALEQVLIAVSGSFEVVLDTGRARRSFVMNKPDCGLYIPPMTWREIRNFSAGSACVVLASIRFDEDDYYRDYGVFVRAARRRKRAARA